MTEVRGRQFVPGDVMVDRRTRQRLRVAAGTNNLRITEKGVEVRLLPAETTKGYWVAEEHLVPLSGQTSRAARKWLAFVSFLVSSLAGATAVIMLQGWYQVPSWLTLLCGASVTLTVGRILTAMMRSSND